MNECNQTTIGADSWGFIDQTSALCFQFAERFTNVWHAERDVMNARAALLQKFSYRRIFAEGLKQLDVCFADCQHRHANALLSYLVRRIHRQTQGVPPNR